ncbi:hypothetical protein PBI_KAMPE_79 [Gordonia phage Kampe]|uniref:Uncharacterized protein n=3 Tax=Gordonia phage Orchid TaxID=1838075 RepID=A0A160DHA1_9CAUD|nr:hypothetical protein BH761_gp078 [Gordonia phage Orchid]ANA87313.1 hypothetical protein PBI_PATRICKSTAR_79 [Gordonia phage PatrickStar]ANA87461.1 hypothetical protein PBI_ORCHID_78 [Gordonia phage Orchid]ANA87576.1 hypothetical protein PBI_KAMPE_79 [Gordonia phage Kampe]
MPKKCPTPNKQRFTNKYEANRAISGQWAKTGLGPTSTYRCRCGYYHKTSSVRAKPRRRR